jgi:hypothetical protein
MKLPALISVFRIATISILGVLVLAASSTPAGAVILNCPPVVNVKAIGAPYPWTADQRPDALLHFAEASYSCSNGTCTLSCAYAAAGSIYTLLNYKVDPGVCHYTNQGNSFACSSLPPPRSPH